MRNKADKHARRQFLQIAALSPLLLAWHGRVSAQSPSNASAACYDPAGLSLTQRNLRRANEYLDPAGDAAKCCAHCNFFSAGQQGCGTCPIMGGGPVSAAGVCDSFAPKAR